MLEQRQNILITGGTGSLGSALVARWYNDHNLTVLSRDPHKQERMKAQYPVMRFVLADICDYDKVYQACIGQDVLIHCAALKIVNQGEDNPVEYSRVNITGSETVILAWAMSGFKPVQRKALYINSDKACSPANLYGHTKAVGERLFIRAGGYSSIRYGNVVSSNGSFLNVWKSRIESSLPIIARTPTPTRFALSLNQAVDLVEDALSQPPGIYVPHSLPAFSLDEVRKLFQERYDCAASYTPLLPGEKVHEVLLAEREEAVKVSDLLARVTWERGDMDRDRFSSATAKRLGRGEIEKWL